MLNRSPYDSDDLEFVQAAVAAAGQHDCSERNTPDTCVTYRERGTLFHCTSFINADRTEEIAAVVARKQTLLPVRRVARTFAWSGLVAGVASAGLITGSADAPPAPWTAFGVTVFMAVVAVFCSLMWGARPNVYDRAEESERVEYKQSLYARLDFGGPLRREAALARTARTLGEHIKASRSYTEGHLVGDLALDVDVEVWTIALRAQELSRQRDAKTRPWTLHLPDNVAAQVSDDLCQRAELVKGTLNGIEESLIRRVAALRQYQVQVAQLDAQLDTLRVLESITDHEDSLLALVAATAGDEVVATKRAELTASLAPTQESINSTLSLLRNSVGILTHPTTEPALR